MYIHTHIHRVWKNSIPKFREVIGETKKIIHCHTTTCWMCVLPVPLTIKLSMTRSEYPESTEEF
jgi:hypothetical protein